MLTGLHQRAERFVRFAQGALFQRNVQRAQQQVAHDEIVRAPRLQIGGAQKRLILPEGALFQRGNGLPRAGF